MLNNFEYLENITEIWNKQKKCFSSDEVNTFSCTVKYKKFLLLTQINIMLIKKKAVHSPSAFDQMCSNSTLIIVV